MSLLSVRGHYVYDKRSNERARHIPLAAKGKAGLGLDCTPWAMCCRLFGQAVLVPRLLVALAVCCGVERALAPFALRRVTLAVGAASLPRPLGLRRHLRLIACRPLARLAVWAAPARMCCR